MFQSTYVTGKLLRSCLCDWVTAMFTWFTFRWADFVNLLQGRRKKLWLDCFVLTLTFHNHEPAGKSRQWELLISFLNNWFLVSVQPIQCEPARHEYQLKQTKKKGIGSGCCWECSHQTLCRQLKINVVLSMFVFMDRLSFHKMCFLWNRWIEDICSHLLLLSCIFPWNDSRITMDPEGSREWMLFSRTALMLRSVWRFMIAVNQ